MAMQAQQPAVPAPAPGPETFPDLPKPKSDDYETYEEYVEALADGKAETKWRQNQRQQTIFTRQQKVTHWQDQAKGKYEDWEAVFHNSLPVSETMADILLESEVGHDLAYHLGQNPAEASRIYALPAHLQGRELGKLEAKLSKGPPPQRDTTKAPSPTAPVGGKETPSRKPEDMSYDEYKKWREAGGGRT